ncbi:ABC transporter permease [Paenibacillus sp. CAA11]|uniref:FtsX-like permease family protein n=1 Tax=Paenibacillus sp. CAA11 TaxID=1532905 RepID=UPI000D3B4585|nr:ABC transporter permease [Paenibacillus sp. CAA11]AWB44769.1 ABC transporter permease [Paenibacillus sp. CAA11]
MTFRSLALSSIKGNLRAYSAFFMSSGFSVMLFYIYASFIEHPAVIRGEIIAANQIRTAMRLCEYIIIIFSVLFMIYSNSAFLKTRKKEFGLYSLFGMTRQQLRRFIFQESMIIATMAIVLGTGLGILFSKLFYMGLAVLLDMNQPIPFIVPLRAVVLTIACFLMLCLLVSAGNAISVGRTQILDLLKASVKSKSRFVYSRPLAVLSVVCLAAGYTLALTIQVKYFEYTAFLVLMLVLLGTYLLYTQLSTGVIQFIQRRYSLYYHRINMVLVAQLGYKLKDYARMLFIVSVMSSVILTSSGAMYLLWRSVQFDGYRTQYENPQSLLSLTLFIGMFISFLFFIAAGSIIYFKQYTELEEDRRQFQALIRMGMTLSEVRGLVRMQMGIIFFLPCAVGILNSLVAMWAMDRLLSLSNWGYSLVIIGIYLLMQGTYYTLTCKDYTRSVLQGSTLASK